MSLLRFTFLFVISYLTVLSCVEAQEFANSPEEYDSMYAINIQMSRINGVYIPKDLEDAHLRIRELTPAASLENFKRAEETEVCRKLHFGIGRWMIHNWNFYEGSRLSHRFKEKGLSHPDDMAQFVLRTLHRKLNEREPNEMEIVAELKEQRLKEVQEIYINDK